MSENKATYVLLTLDGFEIPVQPLNAKYYITVCSTGGVEWNREWCHYATQVDDNHEPIKFIYREVPALKFRKAAPGEL